MLVLVVVVWDTVGMLVRVLCPIRVLMLVGMLVGILVMAPIVGMRMNGSVGVPVLMLVLVLHPAP